MFCELNQEQVHKLVARYGSPLYVFHEKEFKENYFTLLREMRERYQKYNIAYSYKTNYTPGICSLIKAYGGLAEVVSDMEYRLAKRIGYADMDIVYNGPVKGEGLFEHLRQGGTANIDSLDELDTVIHFAQENPEKSIKLAFRVNIDIGQGFISRFGMDAYEDGRKGCELERAFKQVESVINIAVVGLHCHVGRSRSLAAWRNRVRVMLSLVDRYFPTTPDFIDFGSGMNSVMEPALAAQFGGEIPSYTEYAEALAAEMEARFGSLPYEERPWLFTEPGTTLISGYITFLGTVKTIKKVKGKSYVTFDCCGGNMGDICHLKNLPISIYRFCEKPVAMSDASFVGYTCLEHDHIYEGFHGELAVGDVVQFRNVGSYSNVSKPPFILPNCAMVKLGADGTVQLIKRAETFEDIFTTYCFD